MTVPVPFSAAFLWLLLALPGVWLLGRAAAHAAIRERFARPALSFGLAVVFWILSVHTASLLARSLRQGLPIGMIVCAVAGVIAEMMRRRRGPSRGEGPGPSVWMGITALAATLAMAPIAIRFDFHDEVLITGHMSIPAELQNGIYPPRHLTFPDVPLRYHYGFDLVTSSLTALLHLRLNRAIDVATIGLFALSWCLLWTLGERLVGRTRAWILPLCTLFGGGLPVTCDTPPASIVSRVVDTCWIGKHYLNPTMLSYFFQHPWSLGIPVGLTTILVFTARQAPSERARHVVLVGCLAALSMSQAALFVACIPSFLVVGARGPAGFQVRRALRIAAVVCVAGIIAKLFGGFLTSAPGLPGLSFKLQAGIGATLRDTLLWNAQTFHLFLVFGVAGFFVLNKDRLLFGLLAAGSLIVINTIRYEGSDDIMKFATLATLALAALTTAALARWMPHTSIIARPVPRWRTALAVPVIGLCCLSSVVFASFFDASWRGLPWWLRLHPQEPSGPEGQAIAWIRMRIRPGEMVYRNATKMYSFAQWGGLPQPWIQWTAKAFGFPAERIAARERLVRGKPSPLDVYRRDGFRFFVLDTTAEDKLLRAAAEQWISAGQARRAATFGPLWVVEIGGGR